MTREVLAHLVVNNGQDTARIVREADPEGSAVEHRVVTTQRMIDRLHERGVVSDGQHAAATILRDAFERAGLSIARMNARPLLVAARGEPMLVADELAWGVYMNAMRAVGQWRLPLRQIVIDDMTPDDFGRRFRCAGLASLMIALDRLERYAESTGYIAFGRAKPIPRGDNQHRRAALAAHAKRSSEDNQRYGRMGAQKRWGNKRRYCTLQTTVHKLGLAR